MVRIATEEPEEEKLSTEKVSRWFALFFTSAAGMWLDY
jgi:hypothetical protein